MNKILLIVTLLALVVLVPQPATGNHTRHERRDHRCGPSFNCTPCHKHRCCSVFSYCGGGDDYCDPYTCAYQCGFDGPPCKPKVNITSRFEEEMNQAAYNGSATVGCGLTTRTDVSMGWIREHGRRLFCDSRDVSCGECLKVTNIKSGTQTTVRLANRDCNDEDLNDIGQQIFNDLNANRGEDDKTDKQYLTVEYRFIPC